MQLKKTEVIYCKVNTAIAKARWTLYRIPKIKYLRNFFYWKCYAIYSMITSKSNHMSMIFTHHKKKRILILRPDHIGDLLLSLPAMINFIHSLKSKYRVEILINPCNAPIIRALSIFDKAYVFKITDDHGKKLLPSFKEYMQLSKEIGAIDYLLDVRSDAYNLHLLDWLSSNYRGGMLIQNNWHPQKVSLYNFKFLLRVAKKMKLNMKDNFDSAVKKASLILQRQFPKKNFQKPIIVFCPDARDNKKTWGRIESIKFIKALNEKYGKSFFIVLVGEKSNLNLNLNSILDFCGETDITEAFNIIRSARLFVGFDSGLTHFSSLAGIQTISIFTGKTDPAMWASIPSKNNLSVIVPKYKKAPNHQIVIDKLSEFI